MIIRKCIFSENGVNRVRQTKKACFQGYKQACDMSHFTGAGISQIPAAYLTTVTWWSPKAGAWSQTKGFIASSLA